MDVMEAIRKRRSVRRFRDRAIEEETIMKLIDAARWCPTASNMQAYRFIIVNDRALKERLVRMGTTAFIRDAPLGILVLYSNQTSNMEYQDYIQSASAAIQNMLLAACSMGLGACWICHLPPKKELRKLLNIPKNYDPIAYIALGYPEKIPSTVPRKHEVRELVSYNTFNFREERQKFGRFVHKIYSKVKPRKDDYWCRKCGKHVSDCRCAVKE